MTMAAVVCKPLGILPPSSLTQSSAALHPRHPIKSHFHYRHERPFSASFKARVNTRRVCVRAAATQGNGDKANCNEEGKVDDDANVDAACGKKSEKKSLASSDQPEPVKQHQQDQGEHQHEPSVERGRPIRGRVQGLACKIGSHGKATTTPSKREEDLKGQQNQNLQQEKEEQPGNKQPAGDSKQEVRCRLKSWWRNMCRPQHLLAVFLTGLLLYAFALFGWQVMVVAVDVTIFVLKC